MGALRFILALVIVVFLVSFGVQNMTPVPLKYYGMSLKEYPLFFLLLGAFVLGALMAWFFGLLEKVRLRWRLRKEKSRMDKLAGRVQDMEGKSLVPVLVEDDYDKESPVERVGWTGP